MLQSYDDDADDQEKALSITSAMADLRRRHDGIMKEDVLPNFRKFDLDGNGAIDSSELQALAKLLG